MLAGPPWPSDEGEVRDDDEVGREGQLSDHPRHEQLTDLRQAVDRARERRLEAQAAAQDGGELDQGVAGRADEDADRDALDPGRWGKDDDADDDADVVDQWRESRHQESVLGLEDALGRDPEPKQQGRQHEDPHQAGRQGDVLIGEVRGDQVADDRVGQQEDQQAGNQREANGPRQYGVGELPGPAPVALGQEAGEDRDEGRAEPGRHHDEEEQIGQPEGRGVGVGFAAGPELVGDQDLADEAEDPAGDEGKGDDERVAGDAVRLGAGDGVSQRLELDGFLLGRGRQLVGGRRKRRVVAGAAGNRWPVTRSPRHWSHASSSRC